MTPIPHTFILIITCALFSCDRVRNKTGQVVEVVTEKAKTEAEEQTQKLADVIFPPFDHDEADTENNKKRFKDFIKVPITPDVKNIYCFDDAIGIDADYMFAFHCNETTSEEIIRIHQLTKDTLDHDHAFGLQHDFDWWDKKRIEQLQQYSWSDGKQYHKYYWYDDENEQAYFFDFDL